MSPWGDPPPPPPALKADRRIRELHHLAALITLWEEEQAELHHWRTRHQQLERRIALVRRWIFGPH